MAANLISSELCTTFSKQMVFIIIRDAKVQFGSIRHPFCQNQNQNQNHKNHLSKNNLI